MVRTVAGAGGSQTVQTRPATLSTPGPLTLRGAGRSFSDAALGEQTVFCTEDPSLTGIHGLDAVGVVEVGAGVTVGALSQWLAVRGRALPVVGGTRHATVGGAIAADVHGKNDLWDGSFGNHTAALELEDGAGRARWCSPTQEPRAFAATVGGMGLTGRIRRARLATVARESRAARWTGRRFRGIDAMLAAFDEVDPAVRWTAAWVDLHRGRLRGILHTLRPTPGPLAEEPPPTLPLALPLPAVSVLRPATAGLLNAAIWRLTPLRPATVHLWDQLWSTDRIVGWRQLYGPGGAEELQFAAPAAAFPAALRTVLRLGREAGISPCFAMVKRLGNHDRAGILSFPAEGYTFTANYRATPATAPLFRRVIDEAVIPAGGRLYLAKDTAMTPAQARAVLPGLAEWQEAVQQLDPEGRFQSRLSRRLDLKP